MNQGGAYLIWFCFAVASSENSREEIGESRELDLHFNIPFGKMAQVESIVLKSFRLR